MLQYPPYNTTVGERKFGYDGLVYEVVQDATCSQKWQLTPESEHAKSKWGRNNIVRFRLRPELIVFDEDCDIHDDFEISVVDKYALAEYQVAPFDSDKAIGIVWSSLPIHDINNIDAFYLVDRYCNRIEWNDERKLYEVEMVFRSSDDARDFVDDPEKLNSSYDEDGYKYDTWMEGDIGVAPNVEMGLALVEDEIYIDTDK
jgi:hypothetical protein